MKKLLLFTLCIFYSLSLQANDFTDIKLQGDQQYEDGFVRQAWLSWQLALEKCPTEKQLPLLLRLARNAAEAEKGDSTLALFSQVLKQKKLATIAPESTYEFYLHKALLETHTTKYADAIQTCNIIIKAGKKRSLEVLQSALQTAVFALQKNNQLKEAEALIEKNLETFKNKSTTLLTLAQIKIVLLQYKDALKILEPLKKENLPQAHFLTMWAHFKNAELEKSLKIFNENIKALKVSPHPLLSDTMIKMAESIAKSDDFYLILDKAFELEKVDTTKAYILLKKAEIYIQSDRADKAIPVLLTFIQKYRLSNKIDEVYLQLAHLYSKKEKNDKVQAVVYYSKTIDNKAVHPKLLYQALMARAATLQFLGNSVEAATDFTAAAETARRANYPQEKVSAALYSAGLVQFINATVQKDISLFISSATFFKRVIVEDTIHREKAYIMQAQALRKAGQQQQAAKNTLSNQGLRVEVTEAPDSQSAGTQEFEQVTLGRRVGLLGA
ncbi:MAG: hypothetical protein HRT88_14745, partial [Lentisphaeraceae bacterium]|nr:hypothetical protein [Lentisphaeraceae bacterium]